MKILYLDDSGKFHPNDASRAVSFGGFSLGHAAWHDFTRDIIRIKGAYFPKLGNPAEWEMKSPDLLKETNFRRKTKRGFCFEILRTLKRHKCRVYASVAVKANANTPAKGSHEEAYVPLSVHRLVPQFFDEIKREKEAGHIILDWSTYNLDRHVTSCVASMVMSRRMDALVASVSYGSSHATIPLQVADLIAGAFRRNTEGATHLDPLIDAFMALRHRRKGKCVTGVAVNSYQRLF